MRNQIPAKGERNMGKKIDLSDERLLRTLSVYTRRGQMAHAFALAARRKLRDVGKEARGRNLKFAR